MKPNGLQLALRLNGNEKQRVWGLPAIAIGQRTQRRITPRIRSDGKSQDEEPITLKE